MTHCNLDGINYFCWTHGVDIGPEDLASGACYVGACEAEDEDDADLYDPDWDDPRAPPAGGGA